MTTRAALYARYSTDRQSDRSVDDQLRLCTEFARAQGMGVAAAFSDAAISGQQITQREGLQALLRAIKRPAEARGFDVLIVEHADRLTRHPGHVHMIREAFVFAAVPIIQVNGGELDLMKASISGLVSSMTLDSVKDKTRRGMAGRAAEGLRMGGRLYGYAPVKGEPGHVSIDAGQADVVRRIFALYIDGLSARAIAARLNAEAVTPPRGARWNASTIGGWGQRGNGIIGNETYAGVMTWNKVRMMRDPETERRVSRPNPPSAWLRATVPDLAIITSATFAAAQAKRIGRREVPNQRAPRHLLTGLLRCPNCGGGMSIKDGRDKARRIRCTTQAESGSCTNRHTYNLTRIETAVVARLRAELESPEALRLYASTFNAERTRLAKARSGARARNERDLTEVEASLHRAVAAVVNGTAAPDTMAPHIKALEARQTALRAELAATAAAQPLMLHSRAHEILKAQLASLGETIRQAAAMGNSEPASAFRTLVQRVTVLPDYELEITGDLSPILAQDGGLMLVAGEGCERSPRPVLPFVLRAAA